MKLARTLAVLALFAEGTIAAQSAQVEPPGRSQAGTDSLWVLTLTTGPGWDTTKAPNGQRYFGDHSRNLSRLRQEGKLLVGGRFGGTGLLLLRARSEVEARAMFTPDSTIATGVFAAKFEVWRTIFAGAVPPR